MSEFTPLELSRVRTKLLLEHPFFGSLAMRLRYVADSGIPTLCTNGTEIRYSPAFMERLTMPERKGVFVHELAHCFLSHVFRRNGRSMRSWNEACDYAINPMIAKTVGLALPQGVKDETGKVIFSAPLLDAKYEGMSAEAIYAKREQEKQKEQEQKQNGGKGQGDSSGEEKSDGDDAGEGGESEGDSESASSGDSETASDTGDNGTGRADTNAGGTDPGAGKSGTQGGAPDEKVRGNSGGSGEIPSVTGEFEDGKVDAEGAAPGDMNEDDWKIVTEQAICVARAAGKLPGEWVEDILASRVPKMDPWAVIEQFVDHEVQSDFSWTSPNRRMLAQGLYLPGVLKENIGEMVFGIDTSGSATSKMLAEWASHISEIVKKYQPSKVHVVMCDTRVTDVQTYEPSEFDNISFQCKGRGGTEFQPVFDWVEEQGISPVCLIYFTDLYGPKPKQPDYPVLWAVPEYQKMEGPFGETVLIGVE